ILNVVKEETLEIKNNYADARRTKIDYSISVNSSKRDILDFIEDKQVLVMLTSQNYIKRIPLDTYHQQQRGGRGVIGMTTKEEDEVSTVVLTSTHDNLLCFTDIGRAYWLNVYEIPEGTRQSKGKAIVNLLNLKNENVLAVIPLRTYDSDKYIFYATQRGRVGKMSEKLFSHPNSGGIKAINILNNDKLIRIMVTNGSNDVVLTTKQGKSLRFSETNVRATLRGGQGVIGMRLKADDCVKDMTLVEKDHLLIVTEKGFGKRTSFDEFRGHGRGTMGVINIKTNEKRGNVVSALAVNDNDDLVITTLNGVVMRTKSSGISIQKRGTQGVKVIKVDNNDKVASITIVPSDNNK
ncbi:MAG TPA: DNA gyrase subunit A, partial [Methanocorpusculum sp.]|nr:DNA gyrase subunit A [Methanocorpusculum sp.]